MGSLRHAAPRQLVGRLLKRLGLHVRRLERDTLVVTRHSPARLQRVDEGSWLVQEDGARTRRVHPVGDAGVGATLVWNRRSARKRPMAFQRELSQLLGAEQLAWTLSALHVNCVLDVGANIGQYAHRLRDVGYRGRIVSFEPVAEPLRQLREASAADRRWRVLPYAAGAESSSAEIHTSPGTLSSLLPASEFGRAWSSRLRETTTETISVRRLDELWAEATEGIDEPRVFVKLDTQGYDLTAFEGLGNRAAEIVGLQSELACVPIYDGMPRLPEQLNAYLDAGLELAGMFPVSRERKTQRVIEFDAIMVRAEAFGPRRAGHRARATRPSSQTGPDDS